jgi:hypothetical protein
VYDGVQYPSAHWSLALQQSELELHSPQLGAHDDTVPSHTPPVASGGMLQVSPGQQSASCVQLPVGATQSGATPQKPSSQLPEQHCPADVHVDPLGTHAPHFPSTHASTPAQQVCASDEGGSVHVVPVARHAVGAAFVQTYPAPEPRSQAPSQQVVSASPEHAPPGGVHAEAAAHRSVPSTSSGTQGARPQHWSRNWQTSPAGMQQCGSFPSQPVAQLADLPPKQRMIPFRSALQTSFLPEQQFCEAFTSVDAPQMLPGGLHEPPPSQRFSSALHVISCEAGTSGVPFRLQHAAVESQ